MNLIVLHGTDRRRLYERLTAFINEAKKRGWEVVNDKVEDTPSLFSLEKLIILRDYKKIGKKELNILKNRVGTAVIYWEGKIPAAFLKNLAKNTKIEKYDLPFEIWKFLQNINLKSFNEIIKKEPLEYVFAMIFWKMKQKYLSGFDPKYAQIISKLAEIDAKSKTGEADLETELDLLIAKELK